MRAHDYPVAETPDLMLAAFAFAFGYHGCSRVVLSTVAPRAALAIKMRNKMTGTLSSKMPVAPN